MSSLLIGINAKYIHPAMALYQLRANTKTNVDILEFTIKDAPNIIWETIKETLSKKEYQLIGFSCYLWNIEIVLKLLPLIKRIFPIKVMLGGPEVEYDAKYYLTKYSFIDYIITSEGEDSFNELCLYLDNKLDIEQVSNLAYLNNGMFTFTHSAVPDLNKIKLATLDVKDRKNQIVYLESSRGCPYKCSYCTASLNNKLRFFPLEDVKRILLELMNSKTKTVKFLDRTFNANKTYMLEILSFINEYNLETTFQFEIVVDQLNSEIIEFINNLNYKWLRFEIGIQSVHDTVNQAVCRHQDMNKVTTNIKLLNATGKVDLHVDLIAGLPHETLPLFKESFNQTFALACKELQLGFLKFLRGTKLLESVDEHRYIYSDNPPYEIISNAYMSKQDLADIHSVENSLEKYYNSGRFVNTFCYLFDNHLINDYYNFFKLLSSNLQSNQLYDLFLHFDNIIKTHYLSQYQMIHFHLIIDYLQIHKTRPKYWWNESFTKEEKTVLYSQIINREQTLSLEDLYRYSVVIKNNSKVFVIIYKNYQPQSYFLTLNS